MPRRSDVETEDLRVCDDDCRGANGCRGHVKCTRCGSVVCGRETNGEGLCDDCAAEEGEDE